MDAPPLPSQYNYRVKSAPSRKKRILVLIGIILAAFVVWWLVLTIYYAYTWNRQEKALKDFAANLEKIKQESNERALADTYGGKAPEETLTMYIAAVEKGDYDLASKYFIEGNREKELKSWDGATEEKKNIIVSHLKEMKLVDTKSMLGDMYDKDRMEFGTTTESKDQFISRMLKIYGNQATMKTKVNGYDFEARFKLYPNNIWKLVEI